MTTYLLLNLAFFVTLGLFVPKRLSPPPKAWYVLLAGMLLLTLVFDPIIIALHIVAYHSDKIIGLRLFGAPVEDFFYALYAACVVPLVWHRLGERHE